MRVRRRKDSWAASYSRLSAPSAFCAFAECEQHAQQGQERSEDAPQRRLRHARAWQLGVRGEPIGFRLVEQQVKRVQAAQHLVVGAIERRRGHALLMKLLDALGCSLFEIVELAE